MMRYIEADYKEAELRTILIIGDMTFMGDSKGVEEMVKYYKQATNDWGYKPIYIKSSIGRQRKFPEDSDKWNDKCPVCGAPAYKGFTKIECSKGCK